METTRFDTELATALPAPDDGTGGKLAPFAAVPPRARRNRVGRAEDPGP